MKKTIQNIAKGLLLVPALALAFSFVAPVAIGDTTGAQMIKEGADKAKSEEDMADNITGEDGAITTIVNVLLFVIGALAVIMLIYGGIRYVTSGGNQESVRAAKNTILYAVVGLVVAIFAYALVNWVFVASKEGTVVQ